MPTPPEILIYKDADDLALHAVERMVGIAEEAVNSRQRFTLALAGGSTPERAYRLLAQPECASRIDWTRTLLFFGDERFVPQEDERSNYGMAKRTLLDAVPVPPENVFPVPTDLSTPDEAAQAYDDTLSRVFGATELSSPPSFDLILLGLGDDGHTASLFPGASALAVTDRWAVATPPGRLPPPVDRMTLTFPALNAARRVLFLISGDAKAQTVSKILNGDDGSPVLPAAAVRPAQGQLTWMLDETAARYLKNG